MGLAEEFITAGLSSQYLSVISELALIVPEHYACQSQHQYIHADFRHDIRPPSVGDVWQGVRPFSHSGLAWIDMRESRTQGS